MARRRLRFPHATGPATFVLDVSVALPWVVRGLMNPYASAVLNRLIRTTAIVPECWLVDLADAARTAEQNGWYSAAQVTAHLVTIDGYSIRVDEGLIWRAWGDILPLARSHGISLSDAAYLELALRRKLPLATTDATLTAAATAAGVPIYSP